MSGVGMEPLTPQNRIFIKALRIGTVSENDRSDGTAPKETFLYIFPASELASVHAGALGSLSIPGRAGFEDGRPERIGGTLKGSCFIDLAASGTPEDAIIVGPLGEAQGHALPPIHQPTILAKERRKIKAEDIEETAQVIPREEHISRPPSTAGRTAIAGKAQSLCVEAIAHRHGS
jgi:hypothetical protein